MPDKNDKLVEVKTILRSLLIAKANTTVTLKHLCKMYIEMEDCYIPFRDLGFSNLVDFLKSIVDTVTLYTNYAGELCVRHVDTEKSAHITSLVSRQSKPKKPTAKKKASYRPPYNYSPNYKSSSYSYKPSTNAYRKPFVDYYSKPTNNYNGMYNKYKPSNNYSTNTTSNYNSRSVNGYPTSTANNNNSKPMNHAASNSSNYNKPTNGISSMTAQSRRDPLNVLKMVLKGMKNAKITTGIRKVDVLTKVKFELCQAGRDPDDVYSMQHLNDHLDELWEEIELKEDYIYFRDELAIIKEQQRRSLNEKRPPLTTNRYDESPMIYNRQQEKQKKSFVKETPVHETVEAMDTTSQFSRYCQEPKSTPMKAHSVSDDLINEKIRFRLQKLIEKHPEGIWCSELPNEYKKEYSIDLDYKDLGYTCIAEFVAKLPDIFEITKPLDNRLMVLNAKRPKHDFPNNFQKKTLASMYNIEVAKEPEPVPLQLTSNTSKTFFPSGVMNLNETVEIISVLTLSTIEHIEVNVSEIFTPSFFWVTLRENKKKFKAMMTELDDFYKYQDLDLYRIPQVVLQAGLNIACIYAKIWHRGIIKKIKPDGFVVILFYDYGTVSTYHPSDVYFLHTRFSILPAQAIASGLCNTKPIGSIEWPRKSYEAFYDKVWNIPMIAVVSSINEENNTMMITLTDTSDDENDLHINDWMVENNFAEWGKMIKEVPFHTLTAFDEINIKPRSNAYKETKISSTKSSNLTTSSSNLNDTGSFHTASSVATLVQETIGYVKQTHTITQAILLNTPLNKLDDVSNSNVQDLRNERIENKAFGNSGFVSLETFNTPISSDSNDNLSTIKTHLSVKNNYSEIDSIRNEYRPTSQSSRNESDYELPVSHINQNGDARSVNRNSKNEVEQELPIRKAKENGYAESHHDTNVCIKRRPSIHSASSYTSEYSQSNNAELNGADEYNDDKLKEGEDGTIFFERVIENGYKNPTINIKYPSNFAALHANKFENNADSTRVNSIENIKPCDEIDEGYLTGSRRSRTNGSLSLTSNACDTTFVTSPMYIELQLSEKCDNKLIHIFHLENNGWVCMNEVVEAFTNYLDERVLMKLIQVLQLDIMFRDLTRKTDPYLFHQLDESRLKAPRDEENKIVSDFVLTLITCKAMIQLLIDLDFIETKMVKEAIPLMRTLSNNTEDIIYKHFNNKILFDALNVTVQYGVFKRTQKISAK
ncbi:uncharacterized protein LOC100121779 isoform X3 [Nasonia vitripennis]|uniref:HTH OST-type domain-containing protein n=1 Tax=Nasonia vitripennis TaxID=7425 RepID=A0A7M7IPA9_NASVI|nr:uncharacterized protein LOC100121779 isoform X3 [Nasonia vitripennis]